MRRFRIARVGGTAQKGVGEGIVNERVEMDEPLDEWPDPNGAGQDGGADPDALADGDAGAAATDGVVWSEPDVRGDAHRAGGPARAAGGTDQPDEPDSADGADGADGAHGVEAARVGPEAGYGSPAAEVQGWSSAAPSRSPLEQWSLVALVAAIIGALPFTWPVPILSLMGVAFGLVGIRNCQLDRLWRNRWMAVLAVALGIATLVATILFTALGRLQFLPFWTTP
jgi:hypothetical protein